MPQFSNTKPLSTRQLQLRAIVAHGNTYKMMKKYQTRLLLAKTPEELVKAVQAYRQAFYHLRDEESFQKSFVKLVNRFKL